jgi:DNA-binding transcriptional LysR family regulator
MLWEGLMTPARLRTFLTVVEYGSARAAADQLTVTESAVSAALAALHREVGVALFERSGRGLRLTAAGTAFAGYARQILGLLDEGLAAARAGGTAERGRLRLGTVTTTGEYLVPSLLATFRAQYPDVEITLDVGVRDRVFALLADHRLDIVIGGRPPAGRGLITCATRTNSLIVVATRSMASVDVADATWLLREPGSGTRDATLALLDSLELDPPRLTLGSHGAVVASAVLGLGITVVSADAVATQLTAGDLVRVPVPGTPLKRPWHVVTGAAPTPTALLFVNHLTDVDQAGTFAFHRRRRRAG